MPETEDRLPNIRGLRFDEVLARVRAHPSRLKTGGLPDCLYRAIHRERHVSAASSPLIGWPKREIVRSLFDDRRLELVERRVAGDLNARQVWRLADDRLVESVLLWHHDLWTVCVSSQAGCPLACRFCATGMLGLQRNLEAWEIVDQVLQTGREGGVRVSDVVFMGMGEPLLNEEEVYRAAAVLSDARGCQISPRRITISTSGIIPAIHRFIDERRPYRLVFSLTSADPVKRGELMPVQKTNPFEELIDAIRRYERHRGGRHVTLEYVAIKNRTMGDDDIEAIRKHLRGFNFILNVIPMNAVGNELESPTMEEVRDWTQKLRPLGFPIKVRYSGAQEELGGCGQLGKSLMDRGMARAR